MPFQSTLPVRGATEYRSDYRRNAAISIHAPRAGSDNSNGNRYIILCISIHAPRAGSDALRARLLSRPALFQSTLPVRGATANIANQQANPIFQSTLPVRGATTISGWATFPRRYFNPRSPCGERRLKPHKPRSDRYFNPRSPCGERPSLLALLYTPLIFQSTLPVRGATNSVSLLFHISSISIHAPRAGSDWISTRRALRSGRFQSTLPVRGATAEWLKKYASTPISIHAPRAGSDFRQLLQISSNGNFNPRSPCGERPYRSALCSLPSDISIHAPRAGSDKAPAAHPTMRPYFNPRSPCGERLLCAIRV